MNEEKIKNVVMGMEAVEIERLYRFVEDGYYNMCVNAKLGAYSGNLYPTYYSPQKEYLYLPQLLDSDKCLLIDSDYDYGWSIDNDTEGDDIEHLSPGTIARWGEPWDMYDDIQTNREHWLEASGADIPKLAETIH